MTHLSITEAIHLIARSVVRSTPCGCPLPGHVVEGRGPEDPWIRHRKRHCDPARVSHWLHDSLISATPWRGRISFLHPLPRSSALRASTRGLWSDDPSGALPLRDLQAGASGEGWSMRWHSSIDYHFLAVKLKCIIPGSETACRKRRV